MTRADNFFTLPSVIYFSDFPMRSRKNPDRITVIYNSVDEASPILPSDRRVADEDTVLMAEEIGRTLSQNFDTELLEIPFDQPEVASSVKTDIVFNLCEGVGYEFACKVIESLESVGIPYVGANALNYQIGSDKALLKEVLNRYGLPTPQGQFFENPDEKINPRLKFPLLVKPEFEHGSVGITQESVVTDEKTLRDQVRRVFEVYNSGAVAEEYIEGRELQLTAVRNGASLTMFPIKEILFVNGMSERWHVVTFAAKWDEESAEYKGTPTVCPTNHLSQEETTTLQNLGRQIFQKTSCQDYTRIDIRYDQEKSKPYILDVNPNPDLSSDAAVAVAAKAYGWSYEQLLKELVLSAWQRQGEKPRDSHKNVKSSTLPLYYH